MNKNKYKDCWLHYFPPFKLDRIFALIWTNQNNFKMGTVQLYHLLESFL